MGTQFLDGLVANLSKKFSGNKVAVGVDVGTKSVKTVVLKKEGGKIILKNYSIARTEEPLIKMSHEFVFKSTSISKLNHVAVG